MEQLIQIVKNITFYLNLKIFSRVNCLHIHRERTLDKYFFTHKHTYR